MSRYLAWIHFIHSALSNALIVIAILTLSGCGLEVPPAPQYGDMSNDTDATSPAISSLDGSTQPDMFEPNRNAVTQDAETVPPDDDLGVPSVNQQRDAEVTVDSQVTPDAQVIVDAGVPASDATPVEPDSSTVNIDASPPNAEQCMPDEYVLNGQCSSCPPGTQNNAGDPVDGGDTQCTPIMCGENERVRNNMCAACGAGARNEAGDSADGPNTRCDPIVCGVDERVLNNQCTPCPPNTTNPAGDSATGADTECEPVPAECMIPRTMAGGSTLAGYEFRLMRENMVVELNCDDDFYLTREQVDAFAARGIDFSDNAFTVRWRFTVTGPINLVMATAAGNNIRAVVNNGPTVVLSDGADTIPLNAPQNEIDLIYPAALAADPPAIQIELRAQ